MMDLERLDEALVAAEGRRLGFAVEPLRDAARAYRDLLANGERVEPDYEAAARITRELISLLPVQFEGSHDAMVWTLNIVNTAIGDRFLVDPPAEED